MNAFSILKQFWGYETFRPLQEEIIEAVLRKQDTLALLPTGGGKSVCFQVPALCSKGICIVISPLIALIKDQVMQLHQRGIPALAIYSGMTRYEIDAILDRCIYDEIKFLYVSPERLRTDIFRERARQMPINLIAVDEAHCISQWGYDFRPSYLEIADFRKLLPATPLIALTASATSIVVDDIQHHLQFKLPHVLRSGFARPSISYSCFDGDYKDKKLEEVLQKVHGSAIIYVNSRKRSRQLCLQLQASGHKAGYYHAGLTHAKRAEIQSSWIQNQLRIIVATNAFGMGIDKPDVRAVVHADVPNSMEAYYQEAGRAGRDGKKAYAVLLFEPGEFVRMREKIHDSYPPVTLLKRVYQSLANYFQLAIGSNELASYDIDLEAFAKIYGLKLKETYAALSILQRQNLLVLSEKFFEPSKVYFIVKGEDLYRYQVSYPPHDGIIKLLLRMYGGEAFAMPTEIAEDKLAEALRIKPAEVKALLYSLQAHDIIRYQPQKDSPQITFLTPRQDADKLPIDTVFLQARKQSELDKVLAMEHYCLAKKGCRSCMILEYFGEKNSQPCHKCDLCRKGLSKHPVPTIHEVKQAFSQEPVSSEIICNKLNKYNEEAVLNILREMLDNNILQYTVEGMMELKK